MKKYTYVSLVLMALAVLVTANSVSAQGFQRENSDNKQVNMMGRNKNLQKENMKPAVVGSVSVISGNLLTVVSKQGNGTNTVFTVDATNAKIMKNGTTANVSSIVVGDNVVVRGTVNGTNVVATVINDGLANAKGLKMMGYGMGLQDSLPNIVGNGLPVVAGAITTINGSTVTITNKSNVVYTIDMTNAKITQGPNTIAISGLTVGDSIVVQGTVNGNSVVASNVIDHKVLVNNENTADQKLSQKGFFSRMGGFFGKLFGF